MGSADRTALPLTRAQPKRDVGPHRRSIVLANVIFPAFLFPYFSALFAAPAILIALVAELAIIAYNFRQEKLLRVVAAVISANVVSTALGVGIALLLPSGLAAEFVAHRTGPAQGPLWNTYAWLSWPTAFILSVLVEAPVLWACLHRPRVKRVALATLAANSVSYVLLALLVQVFSRLQWWWLV